MLTDEAVKSFLTNMAIWQSTAAARQHILWFTAHTLCTTHALTTKGKYHELVLPVVCVVWAKSITNWFAYICVCCSVLSLHINDVKSQPFVNLKSSFSQKTRKTRTAMCMLCCTYLFQIICCQSQGLQDDMLSVCLVCYINQSVNLAPSIEVAGVCLQVPWISSHVHN